MGVFVYPKVYICTHTSHSSSDAGSRKKPFFRRVTILTKMKI